MNKQVINISGLNILFSDYLYLLENIDKSITKNRKVIITYANFHVCNLCRTDKDLHRSVNNFDIVHADGWLVFLASKLLLYNYARHERINGTDLYNKLLSGTHKYRVFLLGGIFDINENNIYNYFPKSIKITGQIKNIVNHKTVTEEINNSKSDILMVGLGSPFQEKWIVENKEKINVPVLLAVGSGLDYLAGVKKRAPLWMQNIGLEWLHRLFHEPRRLWKRYVLGIPVFLFYVLIQKVKLMLKK